MLRQSNKQLRAKYLLHKYLIERTDFVLFDNIVDPYPDYLKTQEYNEDSLASSYKIQWTSKSRYPFNPITTTIDEMKSTGKIGIIQDLELRRSIIETYNSYESYKLNYQENYKLQMDKMMELIFDEKPELYTLNNSNIIQLFQDRRVRNRFEGNFVVSINSELKRLAQVNQKLLNELDEYAKRK